MAVKNLYESEITFIPFPGEVEQVTCVNLSPDQKSLLICYTSLQESYPQFTVYKVLKANRFEKDRHFR